MTSSLRLSWRSSSTIAADGASMFSSVKYALRFFLMRKARDFSPHAFDLGDRAAVGGDEGLERLGERFDLRRGHVLPHQIDMLVQSHGEPFLRRSEAPR